MAFIEEIKEHKNKETQRFHCQVLHREVNYLGVSFHSEKEGTIKDIVIPYGSTTIAHYWTDRGYVVWRMHGPEGLPIGTSPWRRGVDTFGCTLGEAGAFNVVMLMEDISRGQHVEEFAFDVWEGAGPVTDRDFFVTTGWREIAKGTTIGWKKLLRFPTVTAECVRVRILKSRSGSTFFRPKTFGLFLDPGR